MSRQSEMEVLLVLLLMLVLRMLLLLLQGKDEVLMLSSQRGHLEAGRGL